MRVPYFDLAGQHAAIRGALSGAIERVLGHAGFILGDEVSRLEGELAERIGVPAVVACNSGTDALVMALRVHGVGPGDEVITTAHSFVATANAIRFVGATPVFADIDERTMTIDATWVERMLGDRTKAVIPVHLNGYPCEMEALEQICEGRAVLIEDCAQAFGTTRDGRHVGAGHMGCFSLHPLKVLSACGDGGFITVGDENAATELRSMRNHGLVDRDTLGTVGLNSRLDAMQAAIVSVKLAVVDEWIECRRRHAEAYARALGDVVALPPFESGVVQTFSAFVIRSDRRDALMEALRARGVDCKVHYPIAIHQQPPYAGGGDLPVTERVVGKILSLPVAEHLSDEQIGYAIDACRDALNEVAA